MINHKLGGQKMSKKCIAVHLPVDLIDKINEQKAKTGQTQRPACHARA
jgi:hypothetical protein